MFVSKLPTYVAFLNPQAFLVRMIFLAMFGVEEWSLQHIFSPNWGAKPAKTPHVALMNHPLITTIYLGTDNLTTSSQASKLR